MSTQSDTAYMWTIYPVTHGGRFSFAPKPRRATIGWGWGWGTYPSMERFHDGLHPDPVARLLPCSHQCDAQRHRYDLPQERRPSCDEVKYFMLYKLVYTKNTLFVLRKKHTYHIYQLSCVRISHTDLVLSRVRFSHRDLVLTIEAGLSALSPPTNKKLCPAGFFFATAQK